MGDQAEPAPATAADPTGDLHEPVRVGALCLDARRHEVTLDGRCIETTPTEFRLLEVLAEHPGWVYSTEQLLEQVWGETAYLDSGVVSVHVSKLRRKLEQDPSRPRLLLTVRGVGYKLSASVEQISEGASAAAANGLAVGIPARPQVGDRSPQSAEPAAGRARETDLALLAARIAQLGRPPVEFIGRDEEMEALERLVRADGIRLVTLTGTGGTGKTQLAAHVLPRLVGDFDGIYPVALASIRHADLVASTIVQSVGLWEMGDKSPADRVRDYFRHRNSLLVLDNFEQVIEAAEWVGTLLKDCPGLLVLVTSRTPLRLRGEYEFTVPPLAVPEPCEPAESIMESPAVRLFAERARAVRRDFSLAVDNADVIGDICRRVEGLPLALELAAARIKLLPPEALRSKLEHRLPFLTGGPRDHPQRQQTMWDTVAWSHGLLGESAARLFRRLSVFVGGWGLDAAETVCNADGAFADGLFAELQDLVDQSLVEAVDAWGGEARFSMLETIREFAVERLAESEDATAVREEHARYFMALATAAEPWLNTGRRAEWLPVLERDLDNLRACLHRSLNGELPMEFGLDMASRLLWFWYLRGRHTEGRSLADTMVVEPRAQACPHERGKILWCAGALAWCQGDFAAAREQLEEAIDILRGMYDGAGLAFPLTMYGATLASIQDYAGARRAYEEGIEFARGAGDGWTEAFASSWLADVLLLTGDLAGARTLQEQSVFLFTSLSDDWGRAMALHGLAVTLGYLAEPESARQMFEESAAGMRQADDHYALARVLSGAAELAVRQGEHRRARDLLTEAMTKWREMGNETGLRLCLGIHARLAAECGLPELAAYFLGAQREPLRTVGSLSAPGDSDEHDRFAEDLLARLGETPWKQAFDRGTSAPLPEAVELALNARPAE